MLEIYVDADACPVKEEVYRVAGRYQIKVFVVSQSWLRVPQTPLIERVLVEEGLDRADDRIAARVGPGDVAVNADIPLAHRCVERGARVIAPDGRTLDAESIGAVRATRDLMHELRETGVIRTSSRSFGKQDRSRFLGALDQAIQSIRRTAR